jgi:hypothetical protein
MPWVVLSLWLSSLAGAGWWAYERGRKAEVASQYREQAAAEKASAAAIDAAVDAINAIEVKHVTLRQKTDTLVREVPVYNGDCRHDPRVLDAINAARGAEPAAAPQLPAASSPK